MEDQLNIIKAEKAKVDSDVQAMQHQVEVRNITKKISDLNCKLDMVSTLSEPRENSYIEYISDTDERNQDNVDAAAVDEKHVDALEKLGELVLHLGEIKTSKTFPSLCRVTMDTAIANLETIARLQTINYDGEVQSSGGDPVTALGKCLQIRVVLIHKHLLGWPVTNYNASAKKESCECSIDRRLCEAKNLVNLAKLESCFSFDWRRDFANLKAF